MQRPCESAPEFRVPGWTRSLYLPADALLVMIIDDSQTVRKILEASLNRAGFQAVSFSDGLRAMQALASGEVRVPEVVVLDLHLPGIDGFTLAKSFKQHPRMRQTRIVMLSGETSLWARARARLAGVSTYVTKPFNPGKLVQQILDQDVRRRPL